MSGKPVARCAGCGCTTVPETRYVSKLDHHLGRRYYCAACAPRARATDRRPVKTRGKAPTPPAAVTAVCAASESGRHRWQLVVGYQGVVYGSHGTCAECKAKRFYPAPAMGEWHTRLAVRKEVA